jgi:hypothetical protein
MGLETSAKARRASLVRFYQQQFGPRWAQEAPKLMPLIENYYALDAIREKAYSQNPALAVIQTGVANLPNTPENNRELQQQIIQGFNVTRDSIGKLEEGLKNDTDSSLALKFDQTLARTLAGVDPKHQAQVAAWVQQREKAERDKQLAGGVGTVALLLGGIAAGATGAGLLAFILGAGTTILGGAMAIDGLNNAAQRLDAAQAGDWGGNRLTAQSKILAQQEYAGAWLNVGLALLDAGLTAKTALGMLRAPQAVQTLSRLKPGQLDQFAEARALIQNGKAQQAESLMQKMRGQMSPEEFKRLEGLLNNAPDTTARPYNPASRDYGELLQDIQAKPRTGETPEQMQQRVQQAQAELKRRNWLPDAKPQPGDRTMTREQLRQQRQQISSQSRERVKRLLRHNSGYSKHKRN